MMQYTVVIPTHNRLNLTSRAVRSALRQSHPPAEILVVDDASVEPIAQLEELAPCIRTLRRESRGGGGRSRNDGIASANFDIVILLDSDDELLPGAAASLLSTLASRPDASLAVAVFKDIKSSQSTVQIPAPAEYATTHSDHLRLRTGPFTASGMTFRRSKLQEMGFFDPRLPALQDLDFIIRASLIGPIVADRRVLVVRHKPGLWLHTFRPENEHQARSILLDKYRHDLEIDAEARSQHLLSLLVASILADSEIEHLLKEIRTDGVGIRAKLIGLLAQHSKASAVNLNRVIEHLFRAFNLRRPQQSGEWWRAFVHRIGKQLGVITAFRLP